MSTRLPLLLLLIVLPIAGNAIDMPLVAVDGSKSNLDRYAGKWIVVNYWATWCPPCIAEMPELQSFHDDHLEQDAVVVGINAELIGQQQLQTFLDDYFITYPNFKSKPGEPSELGLIPGLPTTFVVTPKGRVAARHVGPITREMLERFIENWKDGAQVVNN